MAPGKNRFAKRDRDDYVFNRTAPPKAALPRATKELVVACRIFSPGLAKLTDLDAIAANVSYGIENRMCGELIRNLGIKDHYELEQLYKKSYAVYAAEIKRMEDEDKAEAARLAERLAAREAREESREDEKNSAEGSKNSHEKRMTISGQKAAKRNNTNNHKKRRADEEPSISSPNKRPRHDPANDTIPDPYWLSKDDAQAALDEMMVRAEDLCATLVRLQDFYQDNFLTADATPNPTISAPLERLDTQLRQDAMWYVEELQNIMDGEGSAELGATAAAGFEWKRARFDNGAVRGVIERIREFGARLVNTQKEMDEADRMQGDFVREAEEGEVVLREMFLEEWADQLVRVTVVVAHEAQKYVSFRTMEADWEDKWAEQCGEGEEEEEVIEGRPGSSVIVIDSSESEGDDGVEDDLSEED